MNRPALLALLLLAAATVSYADAVVGDFNLNSTLSAVASQGEVTLTLNGDGTIAATLVTNFNGITGFAFNSAATNISESNFSPTAPDNANGWSDDFGLQRSGFACDSCGLFESWTIDGNYTSVYDVLDGGSNSSVDFFLFSNTEYGADARTVSVSPEPGSLALMATGLLGAFAGFRRKRSA